MPLTAGTRLGPYDVQAPLGAGGMGEVYRARDTRLNRDVAIKVLPDTFAGDADRRARFEREAQAVAALSHPNVLAIFDTGLHDGHLYVVTELLEGETLRDRLGERTREESESTSAAARTRGGGAPRALKNENPLPVRKAIEIAIQIARGLAAAHEKGIVHRDIKPENVFIGRDGQVKILDFGLARPTAAGSGATATVAAMTDPGSVMGTVGYMAPEQVRAQPLDARTDLFALGAVLYEMLTGRRAFQRDTAAETMTAILREDPPDLPATGAHVSPALDRIVRHCLEKNPAERFQTARDVAFALEALSGSATATSVTVPAAGRSWLRPVLWAATVVAALIAGVFAQCLLVPAPASVQFDTKTFDRQMIFNARFMPDGKTIVFSAARQDTTPELFILHPDSVAPESIGGAGTHLLAVSSKGELAVLTGATFVAHRLFAGTLARLTPGGSPRQWLENVREADWAPDGVSLAIVRDLNNGRDRLEFPAGTTLYEASGYLSDPRVSHDGRHVAFIEHRYRFDDRGWVKAVDLAKHVVPLSEELWGAEGVSWSADDAQILFSGSDATRPGGVSYEPYTVPASGKTPPHVALPAMTDITVHDVSADGRWLLTREDIREGIVIKKPGEAGERDYSWLDRANGGLLSKDGSLLAFTDQNSDAGTTYGAMLRKTDGSPPVRIGDGSVLQPFSPDGKWVAASVPTRNQFVFYPTGAGEPRRLDLRADQFRFSGWFSDSQHVLLCGGEAPPLKCGKYATAGGAPSPIGPDSTLYAEVTSDDWLVALDSDRRAWLYPPDGRPRVSVKIPEGDPVSFGAMGTVFVVRRGPGRVLHADRVDLLAGVHTPVADISLPDGSGLMNIYVTCVVGEPGRYGYSYSYLRQLSTLVVASGIGGR